jgi:hypothetical protein
LLGVIRISMCGVRISGSSFGAISSTAATRGLENLFR